MIGSREWRDRTHGVLSRRERLQHQAGAIAALTMDAGSRLRFASADSPAGLDAGVAAPSTDLIRAATTWAEEIHQPWLLRHSLRTWRFAQLFGQLDGVESDPEALYLACLLHDAGVTEPYRFSSGDVGTACQCFAVHGAHVSEAKLLELGASPLLASEVADAIAMHLNARVGVESGGAAHLLSLGAGLDVVGVRAADLGRALVGDVLAEHDRAGFVDEWLTVLGVENVERPRARIASFFGVGMGQAIRLNPLNRL